MNATAFAVAKIADWKHEEIARVLEELRERIGREYVVTVVARPQHDSAGVYVVTGERNQERQQKILAAFGGGSL